MLFEEQGFSPGEIAAKLHILKRRVFQSIYLYRKMPKEYSNVIGYQTTGQKKEGKIPVNVAISILQLRLSKQQMAKMLEYAKVHELTAKQVNLIEKLSRTGLSYETIMKNLHLYCIKHVVIAMNRKEAEKICKDKSITDYIKDVIRGNESPNKNLLI